jgi:hypothetical protein
MRAKLTYVVTAAVAIAVVVVLLRQDGPGAPIRQRAGWLVIENQSKIEWRDVSVTLNAYYRGVAPRVSAGGRLEAPLVGFTTGLGQRSIPRGNTSPASRFARPMPRVNR